MSQDFLDVLLYSQALNTSISPLLFLRLIYLRGTVTEDRDFPLLVYCLNGWRYADPKPGTSNCFCVSHVGVSLQTLSLTSAASPGVIHRELVQKRSVRALTPQAET